MLADWLSDAISPLDILALPPARLEVLRACVTARRRRRAAAEKSARNKNPK